MLEQQTVHEGEAHLEDCHLGRKRPPISTWPIDSPPWYEKCQHFPLQGLNGQARRLECLQDCEEGPLVHPDWHALLCESWSLERSTVRSQIRHMVAGLRHLRNVCLGSTLPGRRHERTVQACPQGPVPTHPFSLFHGHAYANQDAAPGSGVSQAHYGVNPRDAYCH